MDVIIVVDMQVGLLNGEPKYDLHGVIDRINLLTAMVRRRSGKVVWVRHCGKTGDKVGEVFLSSTLAAGSVAQYCHLGDSRRRRGAT